jgi:hypothetical protein
MLPCDSVSLDRQWYSGACQDPVYWLILVPCKYDQDYVKCAHLRYNNVVCFKRLVLTLAKQSSTMWHY